jgi:hypothetical protein
LDEIKKENEVWRETEIVSQAAHLGLPLEASIFSRGTWIACCSGTNHTLDLMTGTICDPEPIEDGNHVIPFTAPRSGFRGKNK